MRRGHFPNDGKQEAVVLKKCVITRSLTSVVVILGQRDLAQGRETVGLVRMVGEWTPGAASHAHSPGECVCPPGLGVGAGLRTGCLRGRCVRPWSSLGAASARGTGIPNDL